MEDFYEINRQAWDLKTGTHARSKFYDLEGFKAGKLSLKDIELQEVGDVKGKSLIHLQCHFGLDTLSWARLGAGVTGVDISGKSIDLAKSLADELNLNALFIRSNLYDIPAVVNEKYDIVYTSYGALNWLEDIGKWAEIVAGLLKPKGTFHMVEFHPYTFTLDDDCNIERSYFNNIGPIDTMSDELYTDMAGENKIPHRSIEWNHSLAEVIDALIENGLHLKHLHEFPYQVYDCFPNMIEIEPGKWVFKAVGRQIPYMYSIKAVKE